ncbi:hypothetical protein AVEN_137751-1 [Araneus ventricosus]|uniref:Uncharacterized protein n=1 Tax=Araneus ventricosus TaxID=182803 RepID=A0A4Y2TCS4_ARAVE|nr:hypothetical protein AVEN_137751-1 [Araneus ventricosus]
MGEDNAPRATGEALPLKCHVVVEMAFRRWFYGRRWMDRVLYGEHVLKGCHSLGSGHQLFRGVLLPSFQCFLPDSIVYLCGGRFVEWMVCFGPGPISLVLLVLALDVISIGYAASSPYRWVPGAAVVYRYCQLR